MISTGRWERGLNRSEIEKRERRAKFAAGRVSKRGKLRVARPHSSDGKILSPMKSVTWC